MMFLGVPCGNKWGGKEVVLDGFGEVEPLFQGAMDC